MQQSCGAHHTCCCCNHEAEVRVMTPYCSRMVQIITELIILHLSSKCNAITFACLSETYFPLLRKAKYVCELDMAQTLALIQRSPKLKLTGNKQTSTLLDCYIRNDTKIHITSCYHWPWPIDWPGQHLTPLVHMWVLFVYHNIFQVFVMKTQTAYLTRQSYLHLG